MKTEDERPTRVHTGGGCNAKEGTAARTKYARRSGRNYEPTGPQYAEGSATHVRHDV